VTLAAGPDFQKIPPGFARTLPAKPTGDQKIEGKRVKRKG